MADKPTSTERRDPEARAPSSSDTGEHPVTKGEMRRSFRVNEIYTIIVAIGTAAGALIGGYTLFIDRAEAAGRQAAKVAEKKAEEVAADQIEVRQDVRALYLTVLTGQRQERLERPLPSRDGGP